MKCGYKNVSSLNTEQLANANWELRGVLRDLITASLVLRPFLRKLLFLCEFRGHLSVDSWL